jgi:hypothetical protein
VSKQYFIRMIRQTERETAGATIKAQVDYIMSKTMKESVARDWTYRMVEPGAPEKLNGYVQYQREIFLTKVKGREDNIPSQLLSICERMNKFAEHPTAGGQKADRRWVCTIETEIDGKINAADQIKPPESIPLRYTDVNLERGNWFDEIYDRDAQQEVIYSAICTALETDLRCRYHCIAHGPPACGKTHMMLQFGAMLGEEKRAFLKFDATSMTEAGVRKYLIEAEEEGSVPPVLILEEIEKTEDKLLRWLLGIMDTRGEIRVTNATAGNLVARAPMLVLATANNMEKFNECLAGALASRFSHEIYFPRPDRDILKKILVREVSKLPDTKENERRMEWVEATLKFCHDDYHLDDPRKITPVCMCGKNKLLNGSYQKLLVRCRKDFYDAKTNLEILKREREQEQAFLAQAKAKA